MSEHYEELMAAKAQCEVLQADCDILRAEVSRLKTSLDTAQGEITMLTKRAQGLQHDKADLNEQLAASLQELSRVRKHLQIAQTALDTSCDSEAETLALKLDLLTEEHNRIWKLAILLAGGAV